MSSQGATLARQQAASTAAATVVLAPVAAGVDPTCGRHRAIFRRVCSSRAAAVAVVTTRAVIPLGQARLVMVVTHVATEAPAREAAVVQLVVAPARELPA